MKLSKKEIEHIADLARLDLSQEEFSLYGEQLASILNYIDELQKVNTDGVEPTAQVTGLQNVLRADKVVEWDDNERKAALTEAPDFSDNQIKVKRVLK